VDSRAIIRVLREQGLPHGELAVRAGLARETLSRWESGAQHPSLESLERVVEAAGAQLEVRIIPAEGKLIELVREQLDLEPTERLKGLLAERWPACRDALQAAGAVGDLGVLVGPVAAALHGAPQRPGCGRVDVLVSAEDLAETSERLMGEGAWPDGYEQAPGGRERRERWQTGLGELTVRAAPAGAALRERGRRVAISGGHVGVVLVEDLLRIAESSPWSDDAIYRAGLRAVLASGRYRSRSPGAGQAKLG